MRLDSLQLEGLQYLRACHAPCDIGLVGKDEETCS